MERGAVVAIAAMRVSSSKLGDEGVVVEDVEGGGQGDCA